MPWVLRTTTILCAIAALDVGACINAPGQCSASAGVRRVSSPGFNSFHAQKSISAAEPSAGAATASACSDGSSPTIRSPVRFFASATALSRSARLPVLPPRVGHPGGGADRLSAFSRPCRGVTVYGGLPGSLNGVLSSPPGGSFAMPGDHDGPIGATDSVAAPNGKTSARSSAARWPARRFRAPWGHARRSRRLSNSTSKSVSKRPDFKL